MITNSEIRCAVAGRQDPEVAIGYLSKIKKHLEIIPESHQRGTWQHEARRLITLEVLEREASELRSEAPANVLPFKREVDR